MKSISKLVIIGLVVLTGVVYVGMVSVAQTPPEISATQNTWVLIGYHFDDASNPDEIRQVYASLPGYPPNSLKTLFDQWKLGTVTKQTVRPLLVAYAKSLAGHEAVESFRLGEWCSLLLKAEKDFKSNVEDDHADEVISNMVDIAALDDRAQEFIDNLSAETSEDVIGALKNIAAASAKIDVATYITNSNDEFLNGFIDAILSLPKYVATIIAVYMLGSF